MSFIFLRNRVTGGAAFSPASLFASGEEGAWYEPSTTTAFRSTTDLTPCGYGDSCGFLMDLSKGAGYSSGFTGLGSELVTNGTFDTDVSGWTSGVLGGGIATLTQVSGRARITGPQFPYFRQSFSTVAGKTYVLSVDFFVGTTVNGYLLRVGTTSTGYDILNGSFTGSTSDQTINLTFVAASSTTHILFGVNSETGKYNEWDNISVRELPGNHATQGTEPYRPILARVPPRGRVNELSETDTLATQSVTVTAAQRTLSFTGTGTVTLTGASTAGPLVGTGAGDRVSLTFTPSAGSLTLTVLGTVTDAQLELGASATTYQSVADSLGYDITEAGVTSIDYLFDDEADDAISWTAPADTDYTIARVDTSGNVTILTGQSLSGATDILLEQDIAGYVAVDRALTNQETTDLTAYLEALV